MDYTQIRYEVADGVLTLTLDRPERLNAWTTTMQRELCHAIDRSDADDAVRAVIVTGAGRAFCAGADLDAGGGTFDWSDPTVAEAETGSGDGVPRDPGGRFTLRLFDSLKPVIAAINGPAVGIGITMTLPMDIRIARSGAKIGFVFTRRGVVPEAASTWFLPRIVGVSHAADWMLSGRIFTAEEALNRGLLHQIVDEDGDVPGMARELARAMVNETAPISVALTRRLLWDMLGEDHPIAAHRADSLGLYLRGQSADAHEGVEAFLGKRNAEFPDRVSSGIPDLTPARTTPTY